MAFKIKAKRYVQICRKILARPTRYENSFPKNCGYYDGTYLWGDCWCFNPKTIIWSEASGKPICDNYTTGAYYYVDAFMKNGQNISVNQSSGMPDTTGDAIMNNYCTQVSFSKMLQDKKAPCLLLISGQHMGAYIGEWTQNGKTYNTCEYTSNSMLGNGLCPSYVDQNGARRVCKGGAIVGYWNKAGYLTTFIDYSDSTIVTPTPSGKHLSINELADAILAGNIDGIAIGNGQTRIDNLKAWGYTETEIKSAQAIVNDKLSNKTDSNVTIDSSKNRKNIAQNMKVIQSGSTGETVKILQKILKELGYYAGDIDGSAGPQTVKAIKAIQKDWNKKDKTVTIDGSFGPQSWSKILQITK